MPGDSRLVTASFLNTNFSAYYIGGGSPSTDNTIIMDCSQIIANYNVYANGTGNRCPAQNEITAGTTTTTTTIAYYSFASTTYYYATTALGCANWATITNYYADTSDLSTYPILYDSISLSNPVVGTNDYYPILYLSQHYLIRIDTDGSTSDLYNCDPISTTTTTTTTILCGAYSYYLIFKFNGLDTRASESAASTALCTYVSNPNISDGYTIYTDHSYPLSGDYISVSQYGPPCKELPTGPGWYVTRHLNGSYFEYNVVYINGYITYGPTKMCEYECSTMYYVKSTAYDTNYDACNSSTFNSCDVNELYSFNPVYDGWTPAQWSSGYQLSYDLTHLDLFVGDISKWYKIKNQGTYYTARIGSYGRVYDLIACSSFTTTTTTVSCSFGSGTLYDDCGTLTVTNVTYAYQGGSVYYYQVSFTGTAVDNCSSVVIYYWNGFNWISNISSCSSPRIIGTNIPNGNCLQVKAGQYCTVGGQSSESNIYELNCSTSTTTTTTTTAYDCYNDTLTITNMTKVNSTDFRIYFTPNLMEEYSEWDWKTGTTWYVGSDYWLYAASGDELSMPYSFTGSVSYRIRRDCTDSFDWGPWSNTYVFDWGTTTTTTTIQDDIDTS
jgi:hypothetical protein